MIHGHRQRRKIESRDVIAALSVFGTSWLLLVSKREECDPLLKVLLTKYWYLHFAALSIFGLYIEYYGLHFDIRFYLSTLTEGGVTILRV